MKLEHLLITGIGVILFLYSYNVRTSHELVLVAWVLGIVLVYLGLKLDNEEKKKSKKT